MITINQAEAILILWRERGMDSLDIAITLGVGESDVCRVIHAVREAEVASAELWAQAEDMALEAVP